MRGSPKSIVFDFGSDLREDFPCVFHDFDPRPIREATPFPNPTTPGSQFRSTPRYEGRRHKGRTYTGRQVFRSTPCTGVDRVDSGRSANSAPAGARISKGHPQRPRKAETPEVWGPQGKYRPHLN
jgi:hypothetical protein